MADAGNPSRNEEILCPICGRQLKEEHRTEDGWECRCGEFIPQGSAFSPFEGCTHGLNCNCGRERRK